MKIRPCIDIHEGRVKQIVGGTLRDSGEKPRENYVSSRSADWFASLYREDGMTGGHIIKLGPGNDGEALKALKAWPGGLQIGGGIDRDNCRFWLDAGASHVIVTSWVFRDGAIDFERLGELAGLVGRERLVLDLSCRKKGGSYFVVTDRWQKFTDFELTGPNLEKLEGYCDEFLIHAADVEGLCRGIELPLVESLGQWVTIPVTYAGGARNLEDAELVREKGQGKVDLTIGSALDIFGGTLPYRDALLWNRRNNGVY